MYLEVPSLETFLLVLQSVARGFRRLTALWEGGGLEAVVLQRSTGSAPARPAPLAEQQPWAGPRRARHSLLSAA